MAKQVSFNQWLSLESTRLAFPALAKSWQTTRGRLTRQTVIDRAAKAGVSAAEAGNAYDQYLRATGQPAAVPVALP